MAAHQAPRPLDSPGKNTGVGCHFLLQCMKVKSESEVAQLCPTLSNPMSCSLPGSSVHGIFQARVLEWGAIAFSNSCMGTATISLSDFLFPRPWHSFFFFFKGKLTHPFEVPFSPLDPGLLSSEGDFNYLSVFWSVNFTVFFCPWDCSPDHSGQWMAGTGLCLQDLCLTVSCCDTSLNG